MRQYFETSADDVLFHKDFFYIYISYPRIPINGLLEAKFLVCPFLGHLVVRIREGILYKKDLLFFLSRNKTRGFSWAFFFFVFLFPLLRIYCMWVRRLIGFFSSYINWENRPLWFQSYEDYFLLDSPIFYAPWAARLWKSK